MTIRTDSDLRRAIGRAGVDVIALRDQTAAMPPHVRRRIADDLEELADFCAAHQRPQPALQETR